MTAPSTHELERELSALQDKHRRLLESGSYRAGRLIGNAARSPKLLLRLPLDLLLLAREIKARRHPPGPGSAQYEEVHRNWRALANKIHSDGGGELVLIFSGTTYIQGTRGNRPIRQAHALLARGSSVFFSYHRGRYDDPLPTSTTDGLVQSPNDITLHILREIASTDLPHCQKLFLISYPYPGVEQYVEVFRRNGWRVAYDCRDDWEEFAKVGMARWFSKEVELQLLSEVDVTFCVSQPLVEKMKRLAPASCVHLMPNAVEAGFLPNSYRRNPNVSAHRIGYFGHLSPAWFDWEALGEIAHKRPHYRFEIIGHSAPKGLDLPDNVSLLGPRPWHELHTYAAKWSAAIIPFKMGKLADAVDPVKIYEYLAFGLPVVSFRMPQIKDYPYTKITDTVGGFCEALDEACQTTPRRDVLEAFLAKNTWEVRVAELMPILHTNSVLTPASKRS